MGQCHFGRGGEVVWLALDCAQRGRLEGAEQQPRARWWRRRWRLKMGQRLASWAMCVA
jgi:hypothetical protein